MRKKSPKLQIHEYKKNGTYVKESIKYYICTKFQSSSTKIDFMDANQVNVTNLVTACIFNEAEPPLSNLSEIFGQ